ncbi:MAG: transketolase [Bacilli bacterium]
MFNRKIVNGIRSLSIDMISEAKSGHPGICLGSAPVLYTLFLNHLNYNTFDGNWINRDRFVLSAGHASALLYSTLFYAGYPIDFNELKTYRRLGSRLAGHPEYNTKIGIEASTGPLGEGFATAVGMAIAEEYLRRTINSTIINHYTYALLSDGDLMEGLSYEAASLAGALHLSKLIIMYDSNKISVDGTTSGVFDDDISKRFESMGWEVISVGNIDEDTTALDKAIVKAKEQVNKPTLIEYKSTIGYGSIKAGLKEVHSGALSEDDIFQMKTRFEINQVPFHVSKDAVENYRKSIAERTGSVYEDWLGKYNAITKENDRVKDLLFKYEKNEFGIDLSQIKPNFSNDKKEELRTTNSKLMNIIAETTPFFLGGSADMVSSTKTYLKEFKDFKLNGEMGRNIHFGVRENLMASVLNGLALSGLRPFGSTMLAFSDYMRPGMRLSAMMNLPVTYIFTHDSVSIGEDGPTHQPIEQLGSIRMIPNMKVFRPADVNEIIGSWNYILNKKIPATLIISKSEMPLLESSHPKGVEYGAYIIKEEVNRLSGIIISTGTEVLTAIKISEVLANKGIYIRVISMPSIEIFNEQPEEYKSTLLPIGSKIITLEASNDPIWNEFVYNKKYILNIDSFGRSGKSQDVLSSLGFDFDSLTLRVENLLK